MIYIVRGLLYGDEGKGSIVDYLTSKENCTDVIKEGGPQAAHHIVSKDGKMHRSEQMGSGVFNSGVRTFSSKNALIHPGNLIMENMMLHFAGIHDGMNRMSIDSRCPIVTPLNQMLGQMKETVNKHGSTGLGVGDAVKDWRENKNVLTMEDISDEKILKEKLEILFAEKFKEAKLLVDGNPDNTELRRMYEYYQESLDSKLIFNSYNSFAMTYASNIVYNGDKYLQDLLESGNDIVFEGAQGALLDLEFGFTPYVTKMKTTFDTAMELIGNKVSRKNISKVGVLRAYSTRHGAGPFVTEDKFLTDYIPDRFNLENRWQGEFRIGWFDLVAARYAISINKDIDSIALTNLDRLSDFSTIKVCIGYSYQGNEFTDIKELMSNNITKILFDCKPIYRKFDGWKRPIHKAKIVDDLPTETINYIKYLEDELENGLSFNNTRSLSHNSENKIISIVSVGETSENKIEM